MSKGTTMESLVSDYIQYNSDPSTLKECEIRFGTKGTMRISKDDFDNVISKLQHSGFTTSNQDGIDLLHISLDKSNRQLSNVRIELIGEHVVQDYCQRENIILTLEKHSKFVNIHKKYYPSRDKITSKTSMYDNNDFGFRMAFQLEESLDLTNSLIQNDLFPKFADYSKYFRYIRRVEYTHPKFPFRCHLSIVKNSRNMSQTLKRSGVITNQQHYEIEIECDEEKIKSMTEVDYMKSLKILVKTILCGLQNSKYPIPLSEIKKKQQEYIDLFSIENQPERLRPSDFIGYSTVTLQLNNVQEESFENDVNIRNNYTVTEKADGLRKLLYIDGEGTLYTIDTQLRVQYTGFHTKVKDIYHTVLDGEHILYDKKGTFINLYAAFDIYMLNNIDKRAEPFVTTNKENKKVGRLPLMEKVVKSAKITPGKNVKERSFRFESKRFYQNEGQSIFQDAGIILQKESDGLFEYVIDGLIYTPAKKGIPISNKRTTWNESFKWKPEKYNTIDFLVKYATKDGNVLIKDNLNGSKHQTLHLYCGSSGGYVDPLNDVLEYDVSKYTHYTDRKKKRQEVDQYKPVLFIPTHPYDDQAYICNLDLHYDSNGKEQMMTEENELITDNTIVEFRYDANESRPQFQWKPLRIRYDKTQQLREGHRNFGNNYDTANSNWNSIHHPVTEQMITTGENIPIPADDDVYYNRSSKQTSTRGLRDFHNLVVKNMLIQSVANKDDTLMDFAVGKGGDMPKWIQSELSFIYGVDISRDNIENKKDGACARFLNYVLRDKNIPHMIFATGDSSKNIRTGDALIDDKYRMINDVVFGKGSRDKANMGANLFKHYGIGKNGFDITSCQFAIHYFFENAKSLETFISNVIECTKVGGYFIGTSYDGEILFNMLQQYDKGNGKTLRDKDGKIMWELTKQYDRDQFDNDGSCIGYAVDVYQESINKTFREYLVNYSYLNDIFNTFGFTLVPKEEITSMGLMSSTGLFSELHNHIIENHYNDARYKNTKLGETLNMSDEEKQISFLNRYFVYKKIRHYNGDIRLEFSNNDEEKLNTNTSVETPKTEPSKTESPKDISND